MTVARQFPLTVKARCFAIVPTVGRFPYCQVLSRAVDNGWTAVLAVARGARRQWRVRAASTLERVARAAWRIGVASRSPDSPGGIRPRRQRPKPSVCSAVTLPCRRRLAPNEAHGYPPADAPTNSGCCRTCLAVALQRGELPFDSHEPGAAACRLPAAVAMGSLCRSTTGPQYPGDRHPAGHAARPPGSPRYRADGLPGPGRRHHPGDPGGGQPAHRARHHPLLYAGAARRSVRSRPARSQPQDPLRHRPVPGRPARPTAATRWSSTSWKTRWSTRSPSRATTS